MPKTLLPGRMGDVTDWSGNIIPKQVLDHLGPGCIVRVILDNIKTGSGECVYFRITNIKDGTIWGTAQPTYRLNPELTGLKDGDSFTFRKNEVSEVPIDWQPKWYQRKVSKWTNIPSNKGYSITGWR